LKSHKASVDIKEEYSISSINNVSKHSFEEVEKEPSNHYLNKPPGMSENFNQSTKN
jgi:hypothetical protein